MEEKQIPGTEREDASKAISETEIEKPVAKPVAKPAKKPSEPLIDNGDGTITDPNSGLIWKKSDAWIDTQKFYLWSDHREYVEKVNVEIIKSNPGSDPASVAYKALEHAKNNNINQVLIDTAGRLQNKKNLMDELKKIANVIKKSDETAPHEVILVLDATSGQNIINQLEEFNKIIPVTGLIMTKLDGTAKGGVLIAISKKYKVPIIGLGLGEKEDDLQIFTAEQFANAFTQLN